jgi:hypothetical protein
MVALLRLPWLPERLLPLASVVLVATSIVAAACTYERAPKALTNGNVANEEIGVSLAPERVVRRTSSR